MGYSAEFLEEMRRRLESWHQDLTSRQTETHHEILEIKAADDGILDSLDVSTLEQETGTLVRLKERERDTLREVSFALERLADGTYGYCESTGDEIGEKRLRANPLARLCLEAQQDLEQEERRRNFRPGIFDDM